MEREPFGGRLASLSRRVVQRLRNLPARSRRGLVVAGLTTIALAGYVYWTGTLGRSDVLPAPEDDGRQGSVEPEPRVIVVQEPENQPPSDSPGAADADEAAPAQGPAPLPDTLIWPVQGAVAATYGWGRDATMEDWRFHGGVDIEAAEGEPVLAIADGTVTAAYLDDAWGWVVEIQHAPGYVSRYASLARAEVAAGTVVRRGDPIGRVGTSARLESGLPAHVHLELIWAEEQVDPFTVLPGGS